MDKKYISDEEFDALSEDEQVQALIDMIKDVPRNDINPVVQNIPGNIQDSKET